MDDTLSIAIIILVIVFMMYWSRAESFGPWRRDHFIAQYGTYNT